jgi:hypothetical protein
VNSIWPEEFSATKNKETWLRPVVNHDPKRQHLGEKKMVENGST